MKAKHILCFCTEAELQKERERAQAEHRQPIYSGKCRAIDPAETRQRRKSGSLVRSGCGFQSTPYAFTTSCIETWSLERGGKRPHHPAFERDAGLQLRSGD